MTGYVADLSWKSGARAIEKLDRLRSTMAVNVLSVESHVPQYPIGRDSSVGIETRYGLEGPGIEKKKSRWSDIFRTRPDRPWGPPSLL